MADGGGESESTALEFTPTWIVAAVCSLIVVVSLAAERCLHHLGKAFKGKNQKALFEALLKVKEELMLLGFISLLLTVSQGMIQRICIPKEWTIYMLPCHSAKEQAELSPSETHGLAAGILGLSRRRLLAEGVPGAQHCQKKEVQGFVNGNTGRMNFRRMLRKMTHCRANPKFDFHRYMLRALEADFKKVVGISWYLWIFVVVFMLLNVNGWHTYFWISFIPLLHLLAVGTKLEHVITQLAIEVAEKHSAVEGDLVVNPSDEHFWFGRPKIVLYLIHFILFQNAFEIAFFFWILTTYGFNSCIMDHVPFIVPRLVVGAIIQLLCSYSTLPLYAIVTQMGTFFKKEIFDEHVQQSLVGWAQKAKKRKALKNNGGSSGAAASANPSTRLELMRRPPLLKETAPVAMAEKASAIHCP
nr:unnamed protein product [Digitaria exilis]